MLFKSLQDFNKQEGASSTRLLAAHRTMAAQAYGFTHSNQSAANI